MMGAMGTTFLSVLVGLCGGVQGKMAASSMHRSAAIERVRTKLDERAASAKLALGASVRSQPTWTTTTTTPTWTRTTTTTSLAKRTTSLATPKTKTKIATKKEHHRGTSTEKQKKIAPPLSTEDKKHMVNNPNTKERASVSQDASSRVGTIFDVDFDCDTVSFTSGCWTSDSDVPDLPGEADNVRGLVAAIQDIGAQSCSRCGYNDEIEDVSGPWDCVTCEDPSHQVIVIFDDCTGVCADAEQVERYRELGLGTIAESTCTLIQSCYDDDAILSLEEDSGTNDFFFGDDDLSFSYSYSYSYCQFKSKEKYECQEDGYISASFCGDSCSNEECFEYQRIGPFVDPDDCDGGVYCTPDTRELVLLFCADDDWFGSFNLTLPYLCATSDCDDGGDDEDDDDLRNCPYGPYSKWECVEGNVRLGTDCDSCSVESCGTVYDGELTDQYLSCDTTPADVSFSCADADTLTVTSCATGETFTDTGADEEFLCGCDDGDDDDELAECPYGPYDKWDCVDGNVRLGVDCDACGIDSCGTTYDSSVVGDYESCDTTPAEVSFACSDAGALVVTVCATGETLTDSGTDDTFLCSCYEDDDETDDPSFEPFEPCVECWGVAGTAEFKFGENGAADCDGVANAETILDYTECVAAVAAYVATCGDFDGVSSGVSFESFDGPAGCHAQLSPSGTAGEQTVTSWQFNDRTTGMGLDDHVPICLTAVCGPTTAPSFTFPTTAPSMSYMSVRSSFHMVGYDGAASDVADETDALVAAVAAVAEVSTTEGVSVSVFEASGTTSSSSGDVVVGVEWAVLTRDAALDDRMAEKTATDFQVALRDTTPVFADVEVLAVFAVSVEPEDATFAPVAAFSPQGGDDGSSSSSKKKKSSNDNTGLIAGVVVAAVFFVVCALAFFMYANKRNQGKRAAKEAATARDYEFVEINPKLQGDNTTPI